MSRKSKKRRRYITRHHLTNKVNGGTNHDSNILLLEWERHHQVWHKLFGNLSLEQIIVCLQRIARMKGRTNGTG